MTAKWRSSTWGEEISLEYGKALRDYDEHKGAYRVFGSNGPIGWTKEPLVAGPGVILGRKGAYRGVEYSEKPFFVIDTAYYVVPKTELDMRWLFYAIKYHKLGELDDGSPIPSTTRAAVYVREIDVPTLDEQHRIAHILGTFDDKIELNRRMNETLEAMARALFKSWFVDFDPVRAKMAGRDPGLPKDIADVFPDRLVETEFGEIPAGWRWRELAELVELTRGTTYKSSLKGLPGPVLLGLASIQRNGGFRGDKLQTYGGESPAKLLLKPSDLFVSLKDVTQSADLLGAVARVPSYVKVGRLTQDTVKLSFTSLDVSPEIVYRNLLTPGYREYCRAHATGTTNLALSRDDFLAFRVPQATESVQAIFNEFAASIEQRRESAAEETRSLEAIRDALLPRLLSGEV